MPKQSNEINIRSDEVQEIMAHVPSWMIRWGISLIFVLIIMFLFISWIVKYPDVISGTVELTTIEPPLKLVCKNAGEISQKYFEDNSKVQKGDVILSINNLLTQSNKVELTQIVSDINSRISNQNLADYQIIDSLFTFGSMQNDYSNLVKTIAEYHNLTNENNIAFNLKNLKQQIKNNTALRSVTFAQLNTAKSQLANAKEKYESNEKLYRKEIISKMTFFDEEKKYINAINEVENLKKSTIQSSISITGLEKQLNDLTFNYKQNKSRLLNEVKKYISLINNEINNWNVNYQVTAPINGKLIYLQPLSENQYITLGKELFAIVPNNQEYIGYLKIPKQGYGKVLKNQKVRMKFDNFPFYEYGQLNGIVDEVSLITNENTYLVTVKLTNGLMSSYKKEIVFTPEMSGTAEIITEDLRLIDRIFNRFRKIFDK